MEIDYPIAVQKPFKVLRCNAMHEEKTLHCSTLQCDAQLPKDFMQTIASPNSCSGCSDESLVNLYTFGGNFLAVARAWGALSC